MNQFAIDEAGRPLVKGAPIEQSPARTRAPSGIIVKILGLLILLLLILANLSYRQARGYPFQRDAGLIFTMKQVGEVLEAHNGVVSAAASILVAVFTGTLWWVTWGMVDIARQQRSDLLRSVEAAEKSLQVATRQADIAERLLVAANRPWITVDVRIAGPMTYNENGANFLFEFIMENIGTTPALKVFPDALLFSKTRTMPEDDVVLKDWLPHFQPEARAFGIVIGPKTKTSQVWGYNISYDAIRDTAESYQKDGIVFPIFPVKLVGVVRYQSAISINIHETSFYYNIGQLIDKPPRFQILLTTDGDIEADRLEMQKAPLLSPFMT